jgi:hypothetical protein
MNRRWPAGPVLACAIVAAIASGCTASANGQAVDSGLDGTDDVSAETGTAETGFDAGLPPDATVEACTPDAALTSIPPPDASIGDSGATLAGCLTCMLAGCPTLVSECSASCVCNAAFLQFEGCAAGGTSPVTCATTLATQANLPVTDLVECVMGCGLLCDAPLLGDGGPAGSDAGEGGSVDANGD